MASQESVVLRIRNACSTLTQPPLQRASCQSATHPHHSLAAAARASLRRERAPPRAADWASGRATSIWRGPSNLQEQGQRGRRKQEGRTSSRDHSCLTWFGHTAKLPGPAERPALRCSHISRRSEQRCAQQHIRCKSRAAPVQLANRAQPTKAQCCSSAVFTLWLAGIKKRRLHTTSQASAHLPSS